MIRRLRTALAAALDMLIAVAEEHAAIRRASITRVEAAAAFDFEADLRVITSSEEERAELRSIAIEAAKLDIRLEDLAPMARTYQAMRAGQITLAKPLDALTRDELTGWIHNLHLAFSYATAERARRRVAAGVARARQESALANGGGR